MRVIKGVLSGLLLTVILTACGGGADDSPTPTLTPIPPTLVPTSTSTSTPAPTPTPTMEASTATPTLTPEPTQQIVLEMAEGSEIEPPVEIRLPTGWQQINHVQLYQDVDGSLRMIPATLYGGPVTGGTGFVWLLWAFENIVVYNPVTGAAGELNLYGDGVRLLRLLVLDIECNVGAYDERAYEVGGIPATGTEFAAVDCPDAADTRGWFAVLQQDGLNFAFYIYAEPLEAMDGAARAELEAIMDSVSFHVQEMLERARETTGN